MNKAEILTALPKLSKTELEEVAGVVTYLLGAATGAMPNGAPNDAQTCFDALAATVGAVMGLSKLPMTSQKHFNEQLPILVNFFNLNFKGWDKNKVSKMAFLRAMFELLKKDIEVWAKPSLKLMINNIHRMPEVIDKAFPNYLKSGLGGLILKQFQ